MSMNFDNFKEISSSNLSNRIVPEAVISELRDYVRRRVIENQQTTHVWDALWSNEILGWIEDGFQ